MIALGAQTLSIEAIPVRGHIYLIGGAGSNITVSAGPDGVFLVDSGIAQEADKVLAKIQELQQDLQRNQPAPPRFGSETRFATNLEPYFRTLAPPKPMVRVNVNTPGLGGASEPVAVVATTVTVGKVFVAEPSDTAKTRRPSGHWASASTHCEPLLVGVKAKLVP